MGKCSNEIYNSNKYMTVNLLVKIPGDWQRRIRDTFRPEDAEAIIAAINDGSFGPDFGKPNFRNLSKRKNPLSNAWEITHLKAHYISSNFGVNEGDFNKMKRLFLRGLIERVLLDKDLKRIEVDKKESDGVSILNHNLYDYKLELIKTLRKTLFPAEEFSYTYDDPIEFSRLISSTISEYEGRRLSEPKLDKLYDTYFTLKFFDNLLADFDGFVKIKPEFENSALKSLDMYMSVKPYVSYDTSFNPNEFASAEQYASEVLKTLLDYFKEYELNDITESTDAIGFKGFNFAVTRMIEWIEQEGTTSLKEELDKGNDINWVRLINEFIKKGGYENKEVIKKLLGLKHILKSDSKLDSTIREMINEQRERVVRYQFEGYRIMYDPTLKRNVLVPVKLEDGITDRQKGELANTIRDKVSRFRKNPLEYKEFLTNHKIEYDKSNQTFTLKGFLKGGGDLIVTVTPHDELMFQFSLGNYKSSDVDEDKVKDLIESLFDYQISTNYADIFKQPGFNGENMWKTWEEAIMHTLAASLSGDEAYDYKFKPNTSKLSFTGSAYYRLSIPAGFLSLMNGVARMTQVQNGVGNDLPIYQQVSAIFKTTSILRGGLKNLEDIRSGLHNGISTRHTVWDENILKPDANGKSAIGNIFTRADYDYLGTNKISAQMNFRELSTLAILKSFYYNLYHNSGKITLQTTCLSDKHTHFLVQFLTTQIRLRSGLLLSNVLKEAASFSKPNRDLGSKLLQDEIKYRFGYKAKVQITNIINRYRIALGLTADLDPETSDFNSISAELNDLHTRFEGHSKDQLYELCRTANNGNGVDYMPEADLIQIGDKVYINETVYNNFYTYCNPDDTLFTQRIEEQQLLHAKLLFKNHFVLDAYLDPDVQRIVNSFEKTDPIEFQNWCDPTSNTLKAFRLFNKETGEEIIPNYNQSTFDSQFDSNNIRVELNPVLNSHFYADVLLSNQFNDILFGDDYGVDAKVFREISKNNKIDSEGLTNVNKWRQEIQIKQNQIDEKTQQLELNPDKQFILNKEIDELNADIKKLDKRIKENTWGTKEFFTRVEASRLNMHYKRTVHGGATYTPLLQHLKWGVGAKVKIASIWDTNVPVFSVTGDVDKFTSQDGAGFSSPIFSRMANRSYVDGAVGKNKKTIFSYVDPETGVLTLIKWAEYEITNAIRRKSPPDANHSSAELMFKKMHNIPISENFDWSNFDISKYYQKRKGGVPGITTNTPIFRKVINKYSNPYGLLKLGSHYVLNSVSNEDNVVTASWQEVNDKGFAIGDTIKITTVVESIYDLDQVFGGAYTEQINSNGWLDWSEINNDITYTIVCDNDLKEDFIGYVINASAIKSGMRNVNDAKSFYKNYNRDTSNRIVDSTKENLLWFEISTRYGGAQMNADHIITEAEVTEMSQMISALIQAGLKTGTVDRVYRFIGEVAAQSLGSITDWVNDPGKEEYVYKWIGEAISRSLNSGQSDTLGLAGAFIGRANKSFRENGLKTQIPFSANTVKGVFEASITSIINSRAIHRKYPGGGFVQNPTFDIQTRYAFGNASYGYDEFCERVIEYNKEKGTNITAEDALTDSSFVIVNENTKEIKFNNPFIETLSDNKRTSLDIDDTILVWDPADPDNTMKEVRLNTFSKWDEYRNFNKHLKVAKWSCKPKNLLGSRTFFTVNGLKQFSLYDLDSVRASLYASLLLDDQTISVDAENFLYAYLNEHPEILEKVGRNINVLDEDVLKSLKSYAVWQSKEDLKQLSKIQQTGTGSFNAQKAFGATTPTVMISGINTAASQILIGVSEAKAFNIQRSSDLELIRKQGWEFFKNRMNYLIQKPTSSQVDSDKYDIVAHNSDGETTLVIIEELHDKAIDLSGLTVDTDYRVGTDENVYYLDEDLGLAQGKQFYKMIGNDGTEYKVLVCDSLSTFNKFNKENRLYSNTIDNYTQDNVVWFSRIKFGKLIPIDKLVANEKERQEKRLEQLAKQKFASWEAYKKGVATRIPAQSMQSFTPVEIVGFTNDDVTNAYVSTMLAFLQGSDFDIDKLYIMQYGFTEDGTLATYSDLDVTFIPELTLDLPMPKKRNYTVEYGDLNYANNLRSQKQNVHYIENTSGGIRLIRQILELDSDKPNEEITIVINPNAIPLDAKEFAKTNWVKDIYGVDTIDRTYVVTNLQNWLNTHEATTRVGRIKETALRNIVVRGILDIITDASTQFNLQIPIAMTEQRAAAQNSTMSADEQMLTSWNPSAKVLMQVQNMVGRDVIGIGASSLKAFFGASTYFNLQASQLAEQLKTLKADVNNSEIKSSIFQTLLNVVFNGKFNRQGLCTLANINYDEAVNELSDNIEFIVLNDSDLAKISNVNNKIQQYIQGNVLNLKRLITDLNLAANGSWDSPIDAAYSLSGLISAATDNAKELILSKINATSKFADIYTYLLSIGESFSNIAKFMMSPEFAVVADYAEGNMLDTETKWFDLEHALNFVLDEQTLPNIDNYLFNELLTNVDGFGFLPQVLNANSDLQQRFVQKVLENNVSVISYSDIVSQIRSIVNRNKQTNRTENTEEYNRLVKFVYETLRDNLESDYLLLNLIKLKADSKRPVKSNQEGYVDDEIPDDFYEEAVDEYDMKPRAKYFNPETLKYNEWVNLYRYVSLYLIPKNQALQGISDLSNLDKLQKSILPALKEQRMLAKILGVNQGINTKDFDEYKWVRDIEAFVNERIYNNVNAKGEPQPLYYSNGEQVGEFDLIRFLTDEQYKEEMINVYDKIKSTYNILAIASSAKQFEAMLKMVSLNRKLITRAFILSKERKLANAVLLPNKTIKNGLSYGLLQKFNEREFNTLKNFTQDVITANWLKTLSDIKLVVPYNPKNPRRMYDKGEKLERLSESRMDVTINSFDGLASFKWLMEHHIIDQLKHHPIFGTNLFIRSLKLFSKIDPDTGKEIEFYSLPIDLKNINNNAEVEDRYNAYATAFNQIWNEQLPREIGVTDDETGDWTIGDLFYLYNLYVHKDGFGQRALTRLFDNIVLSDDDNTLLYRYYEYVCKLDSGMEQIIDIDNINPTTDGNGEPNLLTELRIALSKETSSSSKFKSEFRPFEDRPGGQYILFDSNWNEKSYPTSGLDKNYYLFPFVTTYNPIKLNDTSEHAEEQNKRNARRFKVGGREAVEEIVKIMQYNYGDVIPIVIIDNNWISTHNVPDKNHALNSTGFIYDGKIYINVSHADVTAPIHELMHLFLAAMKYSGTPDTKNLYYRMLKEINQRHLDYTSDENKKGFWSQWYKTVFDKYEGIVTGSDLLEEVLVHAVSDLFASAYFENLGVTSANDEITATYMEFSDKVKEAIMKVFQSNLPSDNVRNKPKLLNTPLSQIFLDLNSDIFDGKSTTLTRVFIPINQRIAKFKSQLINNWKDTDDPFDKPTLTITGDC